MRNEEACVVGKINADYIAKLQIEFSGGGAFSDIYRAIFHSPSACAGALNRLKNIEGRSRGRLTATDFEITKWCIFKSS